MSAKKRTKSSKKPTKKDKDLPESVQWLLDFVNLGCKPGKLNPSNVFGESLALKRPPSEPGTPTIIHSSTGASGLIKPGFLKEYNSIPITRKKSVKEILETVIESVKHPLKKYDTPQVYQDAKGNDWVKYPKGKPIFIGAGKDCPTLPEFKDFFSETGVKDEDDRTQIWCYTSFCLGIKINNIFDQHEGETHLIRMLFAEAFVTNRYDKKQIQLPVLGARYEDSLCNGLVYSHNNTLSQVTCAYILDFWHNRREFHKYLRQCRCCGKFWFDMPTKGRRGRKREYCGKKCEDRFNQASRAASRALKASSRKWKKQTAKQEIINWLYNLDSDMTKKAAEEMYEDEKKAHPKNVASLTAFRKSSRYKIR